MDINKLLNPEQPFDQTSSRRPARDTQLDCQGPRNSRASRSLVRRIVTTRTDFAKRDDLNLESERWVVKSPVTPEELRAVVNEQNGVSYKPPSQSLSSVRPSHVLPITPSPSDASISSFASPISSNNKSDPSIYLPIGALSLHNRRTSGGSIGMARKGRAQKVQPQAGSSSMAISENSLQTLRNDASVSPVSSDDIASDYERDVETSEDEGPPFAQAYRSWADVPNEFRCTFVEGCVLDSPDRKVISHFFGRNKKCTRAIPSDVWAPFCRRHYQRTRYRNVNNFGGVQMDLVRRTVQNMQEWGGISCFELILRKRVMQAIKREEKQKTKSMNARNSTPHPPQGFAVDYTSAKWLVPYLGEKKTFDDVLHFIDLVEDYVKGNNSKPPEFEILPTFKRGRMVIPEVKKSLKSSSKPHGITKQPAGSSSSKLAIASHFDTTPTKMTPSSTPKSANKSLPKTSETRSGRGTLVRGRALRATASRPSVRPFRQSTSSSGA